MTKTKDLQDQDRNSRHQDRDQDQDFRPQDQDQDQDFQNSVSRPTLRSRELHVCRQVTLCDPI